MKSFRKVLFICIFMLSGCAVSSKIWEPKIDYDESAKDILINNDGTMVIVFGKKYDYLLSDDEKVIQKLFQWDGKASLTANVNVITAKGKEVEVKLMFQAKAKNLSEKQIDFLIWFPGKGTWNNDSKTAMDLPIIELTGIRYSSGLKTNDYKSQGFFSTGFIKNEHATAIFEDPTALQTTGKVLVTPFTLTADILLLPIMIPYFIYHQIRESQTNHFCEGDFCGYDKIPKQVGNKVNSKR